MKGTMAKKVLVVDDANDTIELIEYRLKTNGFDVVSASSGQGALEKIKSDKPDLIIMDVMMPPPNGFQVCRQLKDDPHTRHIPVILLTAKSTESDQFWGMEAGADAYLTKPYNPEELLTKINDLFGT